jgi:hypothetical protein
MATKKTPGGTGSSSSLASGTTVTGNSVNIPKESFLTNRDDDESVPVRLIPSEGAFKKTPDTKDDVQLWKLIQKRTIRFDKYLDFINDVLRPSDFVPVNLKKAAPKKSTDTSREVNISGNERTLAMHGLPFTSTQAYSLLKFATEKFVKASLDMNDEDFEIPANFNSPYLDLILAKLAEFQNSINDDDVDLLKLKDQPVLIELIWSYWHEEGMLAQTMHTIAKRFQNIRNGAVDPLANLEIDPLRPLNNILWGYIQDAQHRLTVSRRAYEYDHHYGIQLIGKAIGNFTPADSRSKFIEAFHNLLYRSSVYYKEADDLTRRADGFSVLNALKEVHLLLSEGAHNQFGDLPTTAKIEMMMEQWILSQPEIREFLGGRTMVPYDEPWMDRVDTMKTLQGWPKTSVSYYHDLARFGEQIILSIRWTNWTLQNDRDFAAAWANDWRDAVQRYIHCYQTATGVDIGVDTYEQSNNGKATMPAILIQQKYQREKMYKRT